MDLENLRNEIDAIDDELVKLYTKRMDVVTKVAEVKKQTDKNVTDARREKNVILRLTENVKTEYQDYVKQVYETIFATSKAHQRKNSVNKSAVYEDIKKAIANGEKVLPTRAKIACQGIEGAYSGIAAEKLFSIADINYFKTFDGVFQAVEKGFCEYGVLPIENSYAGSVNNVYDLMREHKFYIVKSIRMPIIHNLMAKKGVKKQDIKEIISHEQAISQCREYLKNFPLAKITACANTAIAAKMVAESDRNDIAALSSVECAEVYDLEVLEASVQDSDSNYTRFILIKKEMEFYQGAKRISIMTTLPHVSGSLFKMLGKFSACGINLTKLESRPISGNGKEFMFYFDFECDVKNPAVQNLLDELASSGENFNFLGAYDETI